ncbi:HPr kinase/phosphorylase [Tateyamaria sp.]|uniref:HPr kinase/phosphorylase n=1 Tax=Tateyamaria sp. TaxID=1929288 RepID=UPI00329CEA98
MNDQMHVHATAVAFDDMGVLITGTSGRGKSSLALQLMALGCQLIADDQTILNRRGDVLWASAPETIKGLIEARGVGILKAKTTEAEIVLVINLDQTETERLPQVRKLELLGLYRQSLNKVDNPAWPAAILQYLKGARQEPT